MKFRIRDYDGLEASWAELEKSSRMGCQCDQCKKQFTASDPMELSPRCHPGECITAYWDGWLYFRCSACGRPMVKIAVSKSLL